MTKNKINACETGDFFDWIDFPQCPFSDSTAVPLTGKFFPKNFLTL